MFFFVVLLYHMLIWTSNTSTAMKSDTRVRLGEYLFKDYSEKFLPLKTHRLMNISLSADLYQLLEVNAKDQYLLLSIWMTESWTDDYLYWDPIDFDGKDQLHVPASAIWKPDTYLQNNIEMDPANTERPMTVTLYPKKAAGPKGFNTSQVIMAFPAIYKLSCLMNVKYFPWDQHTCSMPFTSWSFDQSQLNYAILNNHSAGSGSYIRSQEYDLVNFTAKTDVHCFMKKHPNKGQVKTCWSYANFTIEIKQKPLFYIFNLVVPSFVLTIICFMGLFSLSSSTGERTEKVSLGITTMLALSIILLVIGDQMPKTSILIPVIGWYFLILMLLIACALVATVFVVHLHGHGQREGSISAWWCALISCKSKDKSSVTQRTENPSSSKHKVNNRVANGIHQHPSSGNKQHDHTFGTGNDGGLRLMNQELAALGHVVRKIMQKIDQQEKKEAQLEQWERTISALEKILFLVFSALACIATGVFLLVGYSY